MTLNIGAGKDEFGDVRVDISAYSKTINVVADAHYLPFRNEIFDEVHSKNLFEHLKNPFAALVEQKRVLKKSGRLFLLTDNASYWRWHVRLWRFYDTSHTQYEGCGARSIHDKHYAIYMKEHLINFLSELGMRDITIEYATYKIDGMRKIDRVVSRLEFCKHMAYPRIMATGIKA